MGTMRWIFLLSLIPLIFLVVSMIPGVTWRTVEVNMKPHKHKVTSDMWNIHTSGRIDFNSEKTDNDKKKEELPVLQYSDSKQDIFSDDDEQYPFFVKNVQQKYQATVSFIDAIRKTTSDAFGFVDDVLTTVNDIGNVLPNGGPFDAELASVNEFVTEFEQGAPQAQQDNRSIGSINITFDIRGAPQAQQAQNLFSSFIQDDSQPESDVIASSLTYSGDNSPNCRLDPAEETEWDNEKARDPSTLTGISGTYKSIIKASPLQNLRRSIINVAKPLGDLIYIVLGSATSGSNSGLPNPFANVVNPNADIGTGEPGRRYDEYSFNMLMPFVADSSPISFNKEALSSFLEFECRQMVKDKDATANRCRRFMAKWIFPDTSSGFGTPTRLGAFADRLFDSSGFSVPDINQGELSARLSDFVEFLPKESATGEYLPKTYADTKFKMRTKAVDVLEGPNVRQLATDYLQVYNVSGTEQWEYVCVPDGGGNSDLRASYDELSALQSYDQLYALQSKYQRLVSTICQNELGMAVDFSTFASYVPQAYGPNSAWPYDNYMSESHVSNEQKQCLNIDLDCVNQHRWGKLKSVEDRVFGQLTRNSLSGVPDTPFDGGYIGYDNLSTCNKPIYNKTASGTRRFVRITCLNMTSYGSKEEFLRDDETSIVGGINEYIRDLDFLVPDKYTGAIDFFRQLAQFVVNQIDYNRVCPPLDVVSSVEDCRNIFLDRGSIQSCTRFTPTQFFTSTLPTYCFFELGSIDTVVETPWSGTCFKPNLNSCPESQSTRTFYKIKPVSDEVLSKSTFVFKDTGNSIEGERLRTISDSQNVVFSIIQYLRGLSPAFDQLNNYDFVLSSLPLEFFQLEFLRDLTTPSASKLIDNALGVTEEYRNSTKWFGQIAAYHEMFTPARTDYSKDMDLYFYTALENELNDVLAALPGSNWDPVSAQIFEEAFDNEGRVVWDRLMDLNPSIGAGYALVSGRLDVLVGSAGQGLENAAALFSDLFQGSPLLQSKETCESDKAKCIEQFEGLKTVILAAQTNILELILNLAEGVAGSSLPFTTRQQILYPTSADNNLCYDLLDGYRRFLGLTTVDIYIRGFDREKLYLIPPYELDYCDMEGNYNLNRELNNFFVLGNSGESLDTDSGFFNFFLGSIIRPLVLPEVMKSTAPIIKTLRKLDETLGFGNVLNTINLELIFRYPRFITSLEPIPFEEWPESARDRAIATSVADGSHPEALKAVTKAYGAYLAMIAMDHRDLFCGFETDYFDLKTSSATYRPRIVQVVMTWLGAGFSAQGHSPTQLDTKHAIAALASMSYNSPALLLEDFSSFGVPQEVGAEMEGRYNGQYHKPSGTKFLSAPGVRKARSNPDFKPYVNQRNGQTKHSAYNPCVGEIDDFDRDTYPYDKSFEVGMMSSTSQLAPKFKRRRRNLVTSFNPNDLSTCYPPSDNSSFYDVRLVQPSECPANTSAIWELRSCLEAEVGEKCLRELNSGCTSVPATSNCIYNSTVNFTNPLGNAAPRVFEKVNSYPTFTCQATDKILYLKDLNESESDLVLLNDAFAPIKLCGNVATAVGDFCFTLGQCGTNSVPPFLNFKNDLLPLSIRGYPEARIFKKMANTRMRNAPEFICSANELYTAGDLSLTPPFGLASTYDIVSEIFLSAVNASDCPVDTTGMAQCNISTITPGTLCKADGECGTNNTLGNCNGLNVYNTTSSSIWDIVGLYDSAFPYTQISIFAKNVSFNQSSYEIYEISMNASVRRDELHTGAPDTDMNESAEVLLLDGASALFNAILNDERGGEVRLTVEPRTRTSPPARMCPPLSQWDGRKADPSVMGLQSSNPGADPKVSCTTIQQGGLYTNLVRCSEAENQLCIDEGGCGYDTRNTPLSCDSVDDQRDKEDVFRPPIFWAGSSNDYKNPGLCPDYLTYAPPPRLAKAGLHAFSSIYSTDWENDQTSERGQSALGTYKIEFEKILQSNPMMDPRLAELLLRFNFIISAQDYTFPPGEVFENVYKQLVKAGLIDYLKNKVVADTVHGSLPNDSFYKMFAAKKQNYNQGMTLPTCDQRNRVEIMKTLQAFIKQASLLLDNDPAFFYNDNITGPGGQTYLNNFFQEIFGQMMISNQDMASKIASYVDNMLNPMPGTSIPCVPYLESRAYKLKYPELGPPCGISTPIFDALASTSPDDFYKHYEVLIEGEDSPREEVYEIPESLQHFCTSTTNSYDFEVVGASSDCDFRIRQKFNEKNKDFDLYPLMMARTTKRIMPLRCAATKGQISVVLHLREYSMPQQIKFTDAKDIMFQAPRSSNVVLDNLEKDIDAWIRNDVHMSGQLSPTVVRDQTLFATYDENLNWDFMEYERHGPTEDMVNIPACLSANPLRFRLAVAPEEAMSTYFRKFTFPQTTAITPNNNSGTLYLSKETFPPFRPYDTEESEEIYAFSDYSRLRWHLSQFTTVATYIQLLDTTPVQSRDSLPCCTCTEFGCKCYNDLFLTRGSCYFGVALPDGREFNEEDYIKLNAVYRKHTGKNILDLVVPGGSGGEEMSVVYKLYDSFVSDKARRLKVIPFEGYDIEAVSEVLRGTIAFGAKSMLQVLGDSNSPYVCPWVPAEDYVPMWWSVDPDRRAEPISASEETPYKTNIMGGYGSYAPFCNDFQPMSAYSGGIVGQVGRAFGEDNFTVDGNLLASFIAKQPCQTDSLGSFPLTAPLYQDASVNDYLFPMILDYTMDDGRTRRKLGLDFMQCSLQNWNNHDYLKLQNCINGLPYREELPLLLKAQGAQNPNKWTEWKMCPTRRSVAIMFIAAASLGALQLIVSIVYAIFGPRFNQRWNKIVYAAHIVLALATSIILFVSMAEWHKKDEGFGDYSTNYERFLEEATSKSFTQKLYKMAESVQTRDDGPGAALGWVAATLYMVLFIVLLIAYRFAFHTKTTDKVSKPSDTSAAGVNRVVSSLYF